MKVTIGPYTEDTSTRQVDVQIDDYDLWHLDHTLALIIYPLLLELKQSKKGIPYVNDVEDAPTDLDTDARWHHVLDSMIWSFSQVLDDSSTNQYYQDGVCDIQGLKAYQQRVQKGLTLFGKYFQMLWA
jgi:hypothetical protein